MRDTHTRTHTRTHLQTIERELCWLTAGHTLRIRNALSACVCYVSFVEIKTNTHTHTHVPTGKLANKRSNNAGTAKVTKHQSSSKNHVNSKRKILGNSRIYEYHMLRHQSRRHRLVFIIASCLFCLHFLAFPSFLCLSFPFFLFGLAFSPCLEGGESKYVKTKLIDAKRFWHLPTQST